MPIYADTTPTLPRARGIARSAGILYLISIGAGFYAEMMVRSKLIVYSDAAVTAKNILAHATLYRCGFFADVSAMVAGFLSSVLLYQLLRPINRSTALAILSLDIVSNSISLSAAILLYAPLIILSGDASPGSTPETVQSMALLCVRLYELAYALNLAVFSISCMLTGYLIYRSAIFPRLLGLLLMVAGVCYLTNSFVNFMPLGFGDFLFPWILLPSLVAEAGLALWFTAGAINASRWSAISGATT